MPTSPMVRLVAAAVLVAACGGSPPASVAPGSSVVTAPSETIGASPSAVNAPTASRAPSGAVASSTPPPVRSEAVESLSPPPTEAPTSTPASTSTPAPTRRPTPTPKPTAKPTPRPTSKPVVLALEAKAFSFAPTALSAPADRAFGIEFTNADAAIPHNVTITAASGAPRFSGQIVNGVATTTYVVPALEAGDYRLGCIVHPAMTGTLTVR